MAIHMTEAEVTHDFAAVLERVQHGSEVIVERNHRPIAIISPSKPAGRMISEGIACLEKHGSMAVMDEAFASDIEEGINAHREPWQPPSLD